jgi:hypothetical protein
MDKILHDTGNKIQSVLGSGLLLKLKYKSDQLTATHYNNLLNLQKLHHQMGRMVKLMNYKLNIEAMYLDKWFLTHFDIVFESKLFMTDFDLLLELIRGLMCENISFEYVDDNLCINNCVFSNLIPLNELLIDLLNGSITGQCDMNCVKSLLIKLPSLSIQQKIRPS